MNKSITNDIEVSVATQYMEAASRPDDNQFVFQYKILICNGGESTVKLLRRHWYIIDGNGRHSEVEGAGVIGKQPLLAPEEEHEYVSGCCLVTEIGKMYGAYLMERQADGITFEVAIPEFVMTASYKLN